jgi:SOS-response transcriptional repressor LexA
MSGKQLPLPPLTDVGEHSFWYQIPKHDLSMVSNNQLFSLNPGAIVLVDLDEPVAPGHCVLADLAHVEQPVVRQYKAVTDPERKALFALEPLNPAYETIYISDPGDFVTLGRVVFFGNKI